MFTFLCTGFFRSADHLQMIEMLVVIKLIFYSLDTMLGMGPREEAIQKVFIFQSPYQKIVLSSEAI